MSSDTIADMLTQIRNAMAVKKPEVILPYSRMKHEMAKILEQEKYVLKVEKLEAKKDGPTHNRLRIVLKYRSNGTSYIRHIKRISRPSHRIYVAADKIPVVLNGLGVSLLSTSKGILTNIEAKQKKLGGELIMEIW